GWILKIFVGEAEYEICSIILCVTADHAVRVKEKLAVNVEIVHGIVLIRRERTSSFKGMRSSDPCDCGARCESVFDQFRRALRTKAHVHTTGGETQYRRSSRII